MNWTFSAAWILLDLTGTILRSTWIRSGAIHAVRMDPVTNFPALTNDETDVLISALSSNQLPLKNVLWAPLLVAS